MHLEAQRCESKVKELTVIVHEMEATRRLVNLLLGEQHELAHGNVVEIILDAQAKIKKTLLQATTEPQFTCTVDNYSLMHELVNDLHVYYYGFDATMHSLAGI